MNCETFIIIKKFVSLWKLFFFIIENIYVFYHLYVFINYREIDINLKHNSDLIIEPIIGRFDHSEGPHWDSHIQKLYFVDIEAQKIYRFDPITKDLSCIFIGKLLVYSYKKKCQYFFHKLTLMNDYL